MIQCSIIGEETLLLHMLVREAPLGSEYVMFGLVPLVHAAPSFCGFENFWDIKKWRRVTFAVASLNNKYSWLLAALLFISFSPQEQLANSHSTFLQHV